MDSAPREILSLSSAIVEFTHVALIRDGRIAAAGPKHEVLTQDTIKHTYDVPVDIQWDNARPWIRVRSGR